MERKILVIGPAWVGDMVMAQSLFKTLKQENAQHMIDVLASSWTFSLLHCMPEINRAIEMPVGHGELNLKARYQLAKQLEKRGYDQAIILPNSLKSALIPWFANIPQRTGWRGEWRYGLVNDMRRLDKNKLPLMVQQFAALGLPQKSPYPSTVPLPQFNVNTLTVRATLNKFKPLSRGRPILALCPGAAFGSAKRWPEKYYAEVANEKIKAGWDVWLFGSKQDQAITNQIMKLTHFQCENFSGRPDLSETIDLLSTAHGVICNDSGLLHVACALGKPVIALYGPTSPAFTPPLSSSASVLQLSLACQPCFQRECPLLHHRCMLDLMPERVLAAMQPWGTF